jgi:hypothetical protein
MTALIPSLTPSQWLKTPGLERTLLARVSYLNEGVKTDNFSTHPFVSAATDSPANTSFDDVIVSAPQFSRKMNGVNGSSTPSRSDVSLIYNDFSKGLLKGNVFNGQVDFFLGHDEWDLSSFVHISSHVAERITTSKGELTLETRDVSRQLDTLIPNNIYSKGTAKGQSMPLCFGTCLNIEPVLENETTHVYRVNFTQVHDITDVRDNGISVAFTKNTSLGIFTLNQPPVGRITADVKGYKTAVFAQTPGEIIKALFSLFDTNNIIPNTTNLPAYSLGIYRKKETTLREVLDTICTSLNAYHYYTRDRQFVAAVMPIITGNASDLLTLEDVEADGVSIRKTIEPSNKVIVNFAKNYTQQTDGLAGGVSSGDRALYVKKHSSVEALNPLTNTLPNYPDATPIYIDTCLVNEGDAMSLAKSIAAMFSVKRTVYEIAALATPFLFELGQEIELTHWEYGFEQGVNGIVIGLEDNPIEGEVRVELWK